MGESAAGQSNRRMLELRGKDLCRQSPAGYAITGDLRPHRKRILRQFRLSCSTRSGPAAPSGRADPPQRPPRLLLHAIPNRITLPFRHTLLLRHRRLGLRATLLPLSASNPVAVKHLKTPTSPSNPSRIPSQRPEITSLHSAGGASEIRRLVERSGTTGPGHPNTCRPGGPADGLEVILTRLPCAETQRTPPRRESPMKSRRSTAEAPFLSPSCLSLPQRKLQTASSSLRDVIRLPPSCFPPKAYCRGLGRCQH